MPFPIVILYFVGVAGAAAAALSIVMWPTIFNWATDTLLPWFRRNIPSLSTFVEQGFVFLNNLVGAARKAAIQAFGKARPHILKVLVSIERNSNSEFIRKVSSYVRKSLESNEVVLHQTTEVIDFDDLPSDLQASFLRGTIPEPVDVVAAQAKMAQDALQMEG